MKTIAVWLGPKVIQKIFLQIEFDSVEFFTVCTKLAEMALLYSKDLTTAKKVTLGGARPDARDCY